MPLGARKKKPTMAEREMRVAKVYGCLCAGQSRQQIIQFCAENFDVNESCTDHYIRDARAQLAQDCAITREAFMAEALAGYRKIRESAERRGQMMVAKSCLDSMVDLVGLKGA